MQYESTPFYMAYGCLWLYTRQNPTPADIKKYQNPLLFLQELVHQRYLCYRSQLLDLIT